MSLTRPTALLPCLPACAEASRSQRMFWRVAIVAAIAIIGCCGYRVLSEFNVWQWWVPFALMAGIAVADLGSGLVHWAADTWGRDDFPVVGSRLLVPFRVHHINPEDFIGRRFVDTNGDVALVSLPFLVCLWIVPLETPWGGALAIFGVGFSAAGMFTNQIHQWAHMPSPPRPVKFLQRKGVLLGPAAHGEHHARPYDAHYCITTGWCNRPLEAVRFFRTLEAAITRITGAQPRQDDGRYEERFGVRGTSEHG